MPSSVRKTDEVEAGQGVMSAVSHGSMSTMDERENSFEIHEQQAETATVEEAIRDISLVRKLGLEKFKLLLRHFQVPVDDFGKGKAKHVSDLWVEMELGVTRLGTPLDNGYRKLLRSVKVVVLEIHAEFEGQEFFLLLKHMFTDSGAERRDLDRRVTTKMYAGEEKYVAMLRCLTDSLNISEQVCDESFVVESSKVVDELKLSEGFPGLQTRYKLYIYRLCMNKPCLPSKEFETTVPGKMGSGSKRVWRWAQREYFESLFLGQQ
jgi:hypothetical protein